MIYLLTGGEYSDYRVYGMVESDCEISEEEWGVIKAEAIKLKAQYEDDILNRVGAWLEKNGYPLPATKEIYEYGKGVPHEDFQAALKEADYRYVGESEVIFDILKKRGCKDIKFTEVNLDNIEL